MTTTVLDSASSMATQPVVRCPSCSGEFTTPLTRGLCRECLERKNPSTALHRRTGDLLRFMSERGMTHPDSTYRLTLAFTVGDDGAQVYDLALEELPEGTVVLRQASADGPQRRPSRLQYLAWALLPRHVVARIARASRALTGR